MEEDELPGEIEALAVKCESPEVRQWLARKCYLSEEGLETLKSDPDEFVRTCLFENPAIADAEWYRESALGKIFDNATNLERLALMRNPRIRICKQLITSIFDPDDQTLGLDLEARQQLIFAVLSNKNVIEANVMTYSEWAEAIDDDALGYLDFMRSQQDFFARLWALAGKWPSTSGIPFHVYRNVSVDAETKLEIYNACPISTLRWAILLNDAPEVDGLNDAPEVDGRRNQIAGPRSVFEVARNDDDEQCRNLAFSKLSKESKVTSPILEILSYGWTISITLLEMVFMILLLYRAESQTEIITYSALVILYIAVRQGEFNDATRHGYSVLLAGELAAASHHKDTLRQLSRTHATNHTKLSIRSVGLGIVGLSAFCYLILTLIQ